MKLLLTITTVIYCGLLCHAQAPPSFSFQGVARKMDGVAVANAQVGLRITILAGSVIGTQVYQETHSAQTDLKGVFDISIGRGTVQSGDFGTIDWARGKYFLRLEIDATGGTNYIDTGVSQLLSVPYALHAQTAQSWTQNQPVVQTGTFQGGDMLNSSGDGSRLIWYPRRAALAAGYSAGGLWNDTNMGEYSIAFGNQSRAKGTASIAMGWQSQADGTYSLAMGEKAMAVGDGSIALGLGAISKAAGSVSLGAFNDAQDAPAPHGAGASVTDRIFQIGNGSSPQDVSNAFTVLRNGNVGIGKDALVPVFPLDIDGRMRLRHKVNSTAGIYFNNSQNSLSAFTGMINDQKIGFYIGNKWRFQVMDNGNVGIGDNVIDPAYRLDLGGRLRVRHEGNTTAGVHFDNSQNVTTGLVGMVSDDELGFHVGNSWKFWVNGAGNGFMHGKLGVGTDIFVPEFTLDLAGRARIRHTVNSTAGIYFNDSQNNISGFVGMVNDEKIGFYVGSKWRFQVKNNGYVGIGDDVTDPTHLLDVGGRIRLRHHGNSTSGIRFDDSQNNQSGFIGMISNSQLGFHVGNSWKFWVDHTGNGFMRGNLGIGSNVFDPQYPLVVNGRIHLRHEPGRTAGIYFDGAKKVAFQEVGIIDTVATIRMDESGNELQFKFTNNPFSNPTEVVSFSVGATQAWAKQLSVQGTVSAVGYINSSDVTLKRDIVPFTASLGKVNQLKCYHYFWKKNADQGLQTGVIAQEVEEIFPELVYTDEKGIKSVNYIGLIPHLIESVKELAGQNEKLGAENKRLKLSNNGISEQNSEIVKRLEALEMALRVNPKSRLSSYSK